jgi:hypothetical protein
MALVVFDPWATTRKGQLFLFAIREHLRIEELRTAISINTQQRKREKHAGLFKGGPYSDGTLPQQGEAFGPTGGKIGQCQGVEKTPIEVLPTMGHQIDFDKARAFLLPLGKGTHRALGLAPGSRSGRGEAMQARFALRAQEALRCGDTHGQQLATLFFRELQVLPLF